MEIGVPAHRAGILSCNRKLRSYYMKTLRGDAHCGVRCRCRKRPPQAQECAKAHSLFCEMYRGKHETDQKADNSGIGSITGKRK